MFDPTPLRESIQTAIADQRLALPLLLAGFGGVIFEFLRPGRAWPGALGGAFVVLAAWGLWHAPVAKRIHPAFLAAAISLLALVTASLLLVAWRGYLHKQT